MPKRLYLWCEWEIGHRSIISAALGLCNIDHGIMASQDIYTWRTCPQFDLKFSTSSLIPITHVCPSGGPKFCEPVELLVLNLLIARTRTIIEELDGNFPSNFSTITLADTRIVGFAHVIEECGVEE